MSINTSRSIALCNCPSIIIILKCLLHIIYALHVGLPNIRIFLCLKSALLIMWKCYIYHIISLINNPCVNILYEHIYYITTHSQINFLIASQRQVPEISSQYAQKIEHQLSAQIS